MAHVPGLSAAHRSGPMGSGPAQASWERRGGAGAGPGLGGRRRAPGQATPWLSQDTSLGARTAHRELGRGCLWVGGARGGHLSLGVAWGLVLPKGESPDPQPLLGPCPT